MGVGDYFYHILPHLPSVSQNQIPLLGLTNLGGNPKSPSMAAG